MKTQKNGMRAEEIRSKLGLQSKEMPRILKEGLSTKKLTSKGQKRATTYFVEIEQHLSAPPLAEHISPARARRLSARDRAWTTRDASS